MKFNLPSWILSVFTLLCLLYGQQEYASSWSLIQQALGTASQTGSNAAATAPAGTQPSLFNEALGIGRQAGRLSLKAGSYVFGPTAVLAAPQQLALGYTLSYLLYYIVQQRMVDKIRERYKTMNELVPQGESKTLQADVITLFKNQMKTIVDASGLSKKPKKAPPDQEIYADFTKILNNDRATLNTIHFRLMVGSGGLFWASSLLFSLRRNLNETIKKLNKLYDVILNNAHALTGATSVPEVQAIVPSIRPLPQSSVTPTTAVPPTRVRSSNQPPSGSTPQTAHTATPPPVTNLPSATLVISPPASSTPPSTPPTTTSNAPQPTSGSASWWSWLYPKETKK